MGLIHQAGYEQICSEWINNSQTKLLTHIFSYSHKLNETFVKPSRFTSLALAEKKIKYEKIKKANKHKSMKSIN